MKLTRAIRLLTVVTLIPAVCPADSEADLADSVQQSYVLNLIKIRIRSAKTDEERAKRFDDFAKQHPNTPFGAEAELQAFDYEIKGGMYNQAVLRMGRFCRDYKNFPGVALRMKTRVCRLVLGKAPDDVKAIALKAISDNAHGVGSQIVFLRRYLQARSYSAKEKYLLAWKIGRQAVKGNDPQNFVWAFTQPYLNTLAEPSEIERICKDYCRYFWSDKEMPYHVEEVMLKVKGGSVAFKAKKDKEIAEAKRIQQKAYSELSKRNYDVAVKTLKGLKGMPLRQRAVAWQSSWEPITKTPPKVALKLISIAIDTADNRTCWAFMNHIRGKQFYTEELYEESFRVMDKYFRTVKPAPAAVGERLRHTKNAFAWNYKLPQKMVAEYYQVAAEAATAAKLKDEQDWYLFEAAKAIWDTDLKRAIRLLKTSADSGTGTLYSIQSKWFYERLTGKRTGTETGECRFSNALKPATPRVRPPSAGAASSSLTVRQGTGISLKRQSPEVQINAKAGATSDRSRVAGITGQGKWIPSQTPAVVLLPLRKVSTLNRISLVVDSGTYSIVLLDAKGKRLSRFKKTGQNKIENLHMTPVDNVAYVKIALCDRQSTSDGIGQLSLGSSAYPGLAIIPKSAKSVSGKRSIRLSWQATDSAERDVVVDLKFEGVKKIQGHRWPWVSQFAVPLYGGTNIQAKVWGDGYLLWMLDYDKKGEVLNEGHKRHYQTILPELGPGEHVLEFGKKVIKGKPNEPDKLRLNYGEIKLRAKAMGYAAVRFKRGGSWGPWLTGQQVTIPSGAAQYQLASVLDSRAVRGADTAKLTSVSGKLSSAPGTKGQIVQGSYLEDQTDAVAKYISEQRPGIVYSKHGTKEEYEAIKAFAKKMGCYLVSDDASRNARQVKEPLIAVGTIFRNAFASDLRGRRLVWTDREFLNNRQGYALYKPQDVHTNSKLVYITGESPEAVLTALKRVESRCKPFTSSEPFRLFAVSKQRRVFPWQHHALAPELTKVNMEVCKNDRRSLQTGIVLNTLTNSFKVTCTPLRSGSGATIAAPRIRYTGFYEWVTFFGDLRIPTLLIDKPNLPIQPHTAAPVWFTFRTYRDTKPGIYKGKITYTVNGTSKVVDLNVRVHDFTVPPINRIDVYSSASIPYWFNEKAPLFMKVSRAMYENEADHGISMVTLRGMFDFTVLGKAPSITFGEMEKHMKVCEEIYARYKRPPPIFFVYEPRDKLGLLSRTMSGSMDDAKLAYSKALSRFLRRTERSDRFWFKVGDEPGDAKQWVALAKAYKEGGLKITTAHGTQGWIMDFTGHIDAWCPNYSHNAFHEGIRKRQRETADKMWWYCCGYPMTRETGAMIDNMPFYWLTAKWDFDGAYSYAAMFTSRQGSPVPFRYGHGINFRFQPFPDGSIVDSVRRELEAEGVHDCLLLYKLKDQIRHLKRSDRDRAAALQKRLDDLFESVVSWRARYENDPDGWDKARGRLYRLVKEAGH